MWRRDVIGFLACSLLCLLCASAQEAPQKAEDVGIEPVDTADVLPPALPDPGAVATDAKLTIDWNGPRRAMPDRLWGAALFTLVDPKQSADPTYAAWLKKLSPGMVRVHHADMTPLWWDARRQQWNREAIAASFAPHVDWLKQSQTPLMVCVPSDWPAAITGEDRGKYVPPDRHAAALQCLVDLVQLIRDDLDVPVTHWELANEWEHAFEEAGKLEELWPLLAKMVTAVREVDPAARVGGGALTWANPAWVGPLAEHAGDFDFVTWHAYASGDPATPNENVMARATAIAGDAAAAIATLKQAGIDVPVYLTEYNVQWVWQPYERRHANSVGAVYLLSQVLALHDAGVDGAMVWHAMGNAYGLADARGNVRATGQAMVWANRLCAGERVATRNDGSVITAAFLDEKEAATLLVLNPSAAPVTVETETPMLPGDAVTVLQVTAAGATKGKLRDLHRLTVPGFSVTFVTTADDAALDAPGALPAQHATFGF